MLPTLPSAKFCTGSLLNLLYQALDVTGSRDPTRHKFMRLLSLKVQSYTSAWPAQIHHVRFSTCTGFHRNMSNQLVGSNWIYSRNWGIC